MINKKMMVSIFIVAIMVLSTFGFMLSYETSGGQKQEYNGHKLIITEQGIKAKINDKDLYFTYFPTQLEDINMTSNIKDVLKNMKMITITYNPDSEWAEAMAEIQYQAEQTIPEYTDIYVARGVTKAKENEYTIPEVTCNNATAGAPVLELADGNSTEMIQKENCIIATAESENDFYKVYERILYTILGIME
ncbi:MAG: hypothetical protein QW666_02735 [Candidatus Woesearchaeota archaeon]